VFGGGAPGFIDTVRYHLNAAIGGYADRTDAGRCQTGPKAASCIMEAGIGKVAGRVLAAHVFGLCITGIAGTIGTTAGFSIAGASLGLWLGGILSVP
jgi:hypothetical protein